LQTRVEFHILVAKPGSDTEPQRLVAVIEKVLVTLIEARGWHVS